MKTSPLIPQQFPARPNFFDPDSTDQREVPDTMSRQHRPNRPGTSRDEYVCHFDAELRESLCARRERNVDDIVQAEVLHLLERFESVSAKYEDPKIYARIRAVPARATHYRTNNKQRAAGSHFCKDDDGRVARGREVVSGDAPIGDGDSSILDFVEDLSADVEGAVVAAHFVDWILDVVRREASALDAAALEHGVRNCRNDVETAADLDITRETANRRKQRAIRAVRGRLSVDNVE